MVRDRSPDPSWMFVFRIRQCIARVSNLASSLGRPVYTGEVAFCGEDQGRRTKVLEKLPFVARTKVVSTTFRFI
jgi:hypothetical protein